MLSVALLLAQAFLAWCGSCPFLDEPQLRYVASHAAASLLVVGEPGSPLTALELTLRNDTSRLPLLVVDCETNSMALRCPGQRVGMDCAEKHLLRLAGNVEPLRPEDARTVKTAHILRGLASLCAERVCEPWTARHEHATAALFWVVFTGCVVYWRKNPLQHRLPGATKKAN